ncbi:hypothetical protein RB595_007506 [Gaeumannomyces hyphopodioides]
MGFVNAKNKVPEYQRFYQAQYRNHVRLWKIDRKAHTGRDTIAQHPRSKFMITPFLITLWGTLGLSVWGLGRKAAGYNSYWGKE